MVDVSLIQPVSQVAAAIGVCIAAIYYVINLRISQRNQELMLKAQEQTLEARRIGIVQTMYQAMTSYEAVKNQSEIMTYEWSDYEDFERKYGSQTNPEAASKRFMLLNSFDSIGMMLRKGFVNADDLYDMMHISSVFTWEKYKDVIIEGRRRYWGEDYMNGYEYLVSEMMRVKMLRNPSYRFPETLDEYIPDK